MRLIASLFVLFSAVFGAGHARADEAAIAPTFAGIKAAVEAYEAEHPGRTLTVDEILSRLPADFRAGFSLVYDSASIQAADPQHPRVLMYGDDARTILTFNGQADQAGYERLELASLDKAGALEFRFIQMPEGDSGEGRTTFSDANPALCATCHGAPAHYIWGQYARWPGVYGSADDVLELTANEKADFLAFRGDAPDAPRYRALAFEPADLSAVAPYRFLLAGREGTNRGDYSQALELRPNTRFGMLLMRHQAEARISAIAAAPDFATYKYGFAYHLAGCDDALDAALTTSLIQRTGLGSYEDYARRLGDDPDQTWRFAKHAPGETLPDFYAGLATFRAALLGQLWPRAFASEADLRPFAVPGPFGDFLRQYDGGYDFKLSDRGQRLWDVVDAQGPILTGFAGADELDSYVSDSSLPHLTPVQKAKACLLLAQKQL